MKKAVAVLILCLMAPVMAEAQDLASLEQMRQAAQHGNADAQLEMGILYEFGFNMPKSDVNALAWYMHAADQGSALAIKRRDILKSRMTPEEVDAAQKLYSGLLAGNPQKTEAAPAADMQLPATETAPPAAERPSSPEPETPPAATGESPDMQPPTEPAMEPPAPEPAGDNKPSSTP